MEPNEPRILVADDEPIIRDIVTAWLTAVGYKCEVASYGAQALEVMAGKDVQLVLLDIKMSGGSGMDILPEIQKRHRDTAVIVLTSVVDMDTATQAMRWGAVDYLVKPFDMVDLTVRVGHALERRARDPVEQRGEAESGEDSYPGSAPSVAKEAGAIGPQ